MTRKSSSCAGIEWGLKSPLLKTEPWLTYPSPTSSSPIRESGGVYSPEMALHLGFL